MLRSLFPDGRKEKSLYEGEIPDDVCSLGQFSTEMIVEGVLRCLQRIDPPSVNGLSPLLPPGMSARFRLGMSLAQACQDLGYEGEIGYQTFLYSNEQELRRLLMFLVESLPRAGAESAHQPTGKPDVLQRAIAPRIRQELATPWLPPSLRTPGLLATQGSRAIQEFCSQPLSLPGIWPAGKNIPTESKEYSDRHCPPVTEQASHSCVAASILERATIELSAVQEWDAEWNGQGLASRLSPEEYRARKCQRLQRRIREQFQRCVQLGPGAVSDSTSDLAQLLQSYGTGLASTEMKGSRFTHTERFTFTQEAETMLRPMDTVGSVHPSSKESEEGVRAQLEEEVKACEQRLEEVSLRLDEVSGDVKHLLVTITQVREEIRQAEQTAAQKEDLVGVKRRALELLPDAETNLGKLQAVIEGSAQRIVKLAHQWEKHRAPLVTQLRELKEVQSNCEHESTRKLEEIKALREKIKTSAEEAKRKEVLYRQLVTELGNLPREVGRSAYTQRILEIVSNIKKQKEEICKILSDTKDSQKEVNSLSGKLERTFAVTDELVFKDAKKDEVVRKAYKYLAALHENCSHLIRTIEESGTILREVRDLEEQIESEAGKMALGSLEKILADYKAVRQDNAALVLKLQQA
ncbi:coiled-coil domain-containing protein 22 isoform X3 [Hypanus sabinus]|uniref:coiled-coil domain-containing protein 22 isoform X3 n=1 Tax=Hypanus sabinus TaxID=79690 RepID=UPI0028C4CC9B|nr:coiled-coil domain-containing protein 22 isoform X3 [Hypanus sabinus]